MSVAYVTLQHLDLFLQHQHERLQHPSRISGTHGTFDCNMKKAYFLTAQPGSPESLPSWLSSSPCNGAATCSWMQGSTSLRPLAASCLQANLAATAGGGRARCATVGGWGARARGQGETPMCARPLQWWRARASTLELALERDERGSGVDEKLACMEVAPSGELAPLGERPTPNHCASPTREK
jgi:hypothetical protein